MCILDLQALRSTPVSLTPFAHFIVPRFVKPEAIERIRHDFPAISNGGSYPLSTLKYGSAFRDLVDELMGADLRVACETKFNLQLTGCPTTLTVRGHTRKKDGRIHTDSKTKLITVLIYLNESWPSQGGRLRLLRSGVDIDDYAAEIVPHQGTLVAFRCTPNAWHGHKPFVGPRQSLQLNWVVDKSAAKSVERRHRLAATLKSVLRLPRAVAPSSRS